MIHRCYCQTLIVHCENWQLAATRKKNACSASWSITAQVRCSGHVNVSLVIFLYVGHEVCCIPVVSDRPVVSKRVNIHSRLLYSSHMRKSDNLSFPYLYDINFTWDIESKVSLDECLKCRWRTYTTDVTLLSSTLHCQQHYLVATCLAFLQLHIQITYTQSGSLEQLLNLLFLIEWLSISPLNCSGFLSQEAPGVVWAGRCDYMPACVNLMCLCACAFLHMIVLHKKSNILMSQTPRKATDIS